MRNPAIFLYTSPAASISRRGWGDDAQTAARLVILDGGDLNRRRPATSSVRERCAIICQFISHFRRYHHRPVRLHEVTASQSGGSSRGRGGESQVEPPS